MKCIFFWFKNFFIKIFIDNQEKKDLNSLNNFLIAEERIYNNCENCNKNIVEKENLIGFCELCLKNELISNIMANYLIFSLEAIKMYSNRRENNISELLLSCIINTNKYFYYLNIVLTEKPVYVKDYSLTISNLASMAEMNLQTLIKKVKSNICVICQRNINKLISVELPCGCNICDRNCASKCFKLFFNSEKDFREGNYLILFILIELYCLCGKAFNNNDFKLLFELLVKLQLKDQIKFLQKYIVEHFLNSCFFCLQRTQYNFNLVIVKDSTMTKLYKINEFKHVICNDCILKNKVKEYICSLILFNFINLLNFFTNKNIEGNQKSNV